MEKMKMQETGKKIYRKVLIGIEIFMIGFLHLYKIVQIPTGLHIDEISTAYDAFCLMNYGTDRHMTRFPVYFLNHGDGQNALATYLTLFMYTIWGHSSVLALRMVIVCASFLGAIFGFLFCRKKWENRNVDLLFLALYAILPIFIAMQRFVLESQLLMALSIMICYAAAKALESDKLRWYLITGILCAVSLYAYAMAFVILPVFLLVMFVYAIRFKKINWKKVFSLVIPFGIIALPIACMHVVNLFDLNEFMLGPFTINKLYNYRSGDLTLSHIPLALARGLRSALFYDYTNFNAGKPFGTMYYLSIPFIFLGFWGNLKESFASWKEKKPDASVAITAWTLGCIVMIGLLGTDARPNTTRINEVYIVQLYFLVQGIVMIWDFLNDRRKLRMILASVLTLSYLGLFLGYIHYYFTDYAKTALLDFYPTYEDAAEFFNTPEGERALERPLCVLNRFDWDVYARYSFKLSPTEPLVPVENGFYQLGKYRMGTYPEKITLKVNYIIPYSDPSSPGILESLGFEPNLLQQCILYLTPLEKFEYHAVQDGVQEMEILDLDGECLRISGWAVDPDEWEAYQQIFLETDSEQYKMDMLERNDVAEMFGMENGKNIGFTMEAPADLFVNIQYVRIVGIKNTGESTDICSWQRF